MCVRLLSWRQLIEPTRFERLDVKNRSVKSGQYPRLWLLRSWLLIFVDMSRLGSTIYSTDKECTNRFAFDLCYNLSARALTVTANYRLFKFGILLWNLITLLSPLSLSSRSRWSCLHQVILFVLLCPPLHVLPSGLLFLTFLLHSLLVVYFVRQYLAFDRQQWSRIRVHCTVFLLDCLMVILYVCLNFIDVGLGYFCGDSYICRLHGLCRNPARDSLWTRLGRRYYMAAIHIELL